MVVTVIAILILFISCSTNIEYQIIENAKSITIYDNLTYIEGVKCNTSDLEEQSAHLEENLEIAYNDDLVLWKGDNFGVLHMDDRSELKVKVSVYGDFFMVVGIHSNIN